MNAADHQTVNLALGRIFRLMSRPTQEGDVADFERCRAMILDLCPSQRGEPVHSFGRDYHAIVMSGQSS